MAKLCYKYAAMNSGKTMDLLRTAHNYEEFDRKVLVIKPEVDTKGGKSIVTRMGLKREVDYLISSTDSIIEVLRGNLADVAAIFVDEAQFLKRNQVDELFKIAHVCDIAVICYGLRSNFQSIAFEGSSRLLELADDMQELKTLCRCGEIARFNARKVNGRFVSEGDTVVIDGEAKVEYVPLCGDCYLRYVGKVNFRKEKQKIKSRGE